MKKNSILVLLFTASLACAQSVEMRFPKENWQQYVRPEEAGFSAVKLDSARALFERSEAAGLFIVHRGRVLASWGETNRRFISASVRKSFMNAMIGIAVARGDLELDQTLAQLQIDDVQQWFQLLPSLSDLDWAQVANAENSANTGLLFVALLFFSLSVFSLFSSISQKR